MIPTWLVALAAFGATVLLASYNRRVDIRFFSILFAVQFIVYLYFTLFDLPTETMKYAARVNSLSTSIAIIVVMIILRIKNDGR